jgi:hypothetical protein
MHRRSQRAILEPKEAGEMSLRRHTLPRLASLTAAGLLFGDLFLRWQEVSSSTGMYEHRIAEGWHGWGAFAGILLMAILLRELLRVQGARIGTFLDVVASFAVLVFVIERMRDAGETTISLTTVDVAGTRWPGWIGLALAVTLAASSLVVFLQHVVERYHRHVALVHASPAT